MRSRGVSVSIILQNLAQLKALFEKQWESIIGNCDEFLYLGGNEQSVHKYASELLGKETIDTDTPALIRKVAEIFVAFDLEKQYSKKQILELYVNTIYFGDGYYGIKEACNGYLTKEPQEMTLYEATMLAGIPNAPSVYAPTQNPDLTKSRQKKVIQSMVKYGYLSEDEANKLIGVD